MYIYTCMLLILCGHATVIKKNHVSHVRYCDVCSLSFRRTYEYEGHLKGKRHAEQLAAIGGDQLEKGNNALIQEFTELTHWMDNTTFLETEVNIHPGLAILTRTLPRTRHKLIHTCTPNLPGIATASPTCLER